MSELTVYTCALGLISTIIPINQKRHEIDKLCFSGAYKVEISWMGVRNTKKIQHELKKIL
jgi:hypothetical protein